MKTTISVTIDEEVYRQLYFNNIKNRSDLINSLLKNYLQLYDKEIDKKEDSILKRLNEKEAEVNSLKIALKQIKEEKEKKEKEREDLINNNELIIIESDGKQ